MYIFNNIFQVDIYSYFLYMIVVFWKGKVWSGLVHLLSLLKKKYVIMDDQDFDNDKLALADIVLVSPGIKQSHNIYQQYSDKIQSELQFLSKVMPELWLKKEATWIWITATNWKSTTTWVTYQVLKAMFLQKNIWITGNFDVPISEVLAQIIEQKKQSEDHIFVVECSSFMLYGLHDFVFDYSILLNIAKDHLDWHKDFEEYQESKLKLLRHTNKSFFVPVSSWSLLDDVLSKRWTKVDESFDLSPTKFLGVHNKINLSTIQALILNYCQNNGLDTQICQSEFFQALAWVTPLPHRLGLLREINDIKIYDDGICTSSHSLSAALSSFDDKIVLIAWWYDKWDDYNWLVELFFTKVWYAILMWQTALKFVEVCKTARVPYLIVSSLEEAVKKSIDIAKKTSLTKIVFSPWAASFDMFKNVYDRVEQFGKIIDSL